MTVRIIGPVFYPGGHLNRSAPGPLPPTPGRLESPIDLENGRSALPDVSIRTPAVSRGLRGQDRDIADVAVGGERARGS